MDFFPAGTSNDDRLLAHAGRYPASGNYAGQMDRGTALQRGEQSGAQPGAAHPVVSRSRGHGALSASRLSGYARHQTHIHCPVPAAGPADERNFTRLAADIAIDDAEFSRRGKTAHFLHERR